MAVVRINISMSAEQAAWVRSRKDAGDFASVSDVVRDLIRREQGRELLALEAEFEKMDRRDGAEGAEPVEEIVATARKVRRKLLRTRPQS
jgi:Arc/MetJ-type ribon-helix-helix transcriptional regulator